MVCHFFHMSILQHSYFPLRPLIIFTVSSHFFFLTTIFLHAVLNFFFFLHLVINCFSAACNCHKTTIFFSWFLNFHSCLISCTESTLFYFIPSLLTFPVTRIVRKSVLHFCQCEWPAFMATTTRLLVTASVTPPSWCIGNNAALPLILGARCINLWDICYTAASNGSQNV